LGFSKARLDVMTKRKKSSSFFIEKGYWFALSLLVLLAILTSMAFKLIDSQQQKIDSLKFRLDLLYSKLDIKIPVDLEGEELELELE